MTMVLWACIAVIGVSLLATLLLMVRMRVSSPPSIT